MNLTWFGTVRARAAYAFDNLLVYATGGWAFGEGEFNPPGPASFSGTMTSGWAVGGGFEYGFASNWAAKVEYLFMDLGDFTAPGTGIDFGENHILRFGVNYLLN